MLTKLVNFVIFIKRIENMNYKLSRKTEYGMLVVLDLAENYGSFPVHLEEIIEKKKVPKSYIHQILQQLIRKGIVKSKRGKNGGFSLNISPTKLTLLTIVESLDDTFTLGYLKEKRWVC